MFPFLVAWLVYTNSKLLAVCYYYERRDDATNFPDDAAPGTSGRRRNSTLDVLTCSEKALAK